MGIPEGAIVSSKDYLNLELHSSERHEFFLGHIINMAGASREHLEIQSNIIYLLMHEYRSRKTDCSAYGSDLRLKANDLKYFYPDITVVCGQAEFDKKSKSLINPTGVIEILSRSTRDFDVDEKAFAYRAIASLNEFVLIDSESQRIMVYERKGETVWELREYNDQSDCRFFDTVFSMAEIYRNVNF